MASAVSSPIQTLFQDGTTRQISHHQAGLAQIASRIHLDIQQVRTGIGVSDCSQHFLGSYIGSGRSASKIERHPSGVAIVKPIRTPEQNRREPRHRHGLVVDQANMVGAVVREQMSHQPILTRIDDALLRATTQGGWERNRHATSGNICSGQCIQVGLENDRGCSAR